MMTTFHNLETNAEIASNHDKNVLDYDHNAHFWHTLCLDNPEWHTFSYCRVNEWPPVGK